MGEHNITGSEAFDRHRAVYGMVRVFPHAKAWAFAVLPSAIGAGFFFALGLIAAAVLGSH